MTISIEMNRRSFMRNGCLGAAGLVAPSLFAAGTFKIRSLITAPIHGPCFRKGTIFILSQKQAALYSSKLRISPPYPKPPRRLSGMPPKGQSNRKIFGLPKSTIFKVLGMFIVPRMMATITTIGLFVLQNTKKDPFCGTFKMKARLKTDSGDNWAIDGSVFEHKGQLYLLWSGWECPKVDVEISRIYIAEMRIPGRFLPNGSNSANLNMSGNGSGNMIRLNQHPNSPFMSMRAPRC